MIVAIIQARMGSTRLPGKVLRPLAGKPLLWHIVERLKKCTRVDKIVIATSFDHADDGLATQAASWGIPVIRGSQEDVLERFFKAAQRYGATHVVRVTGDNPLTDPASIDRAIEVHLARRGDYTYIKGLPLGTAAEICSMHALAEAYYRGHEQPHREHVTVYLKEHPEDYHNIILAAEPELNWPELRLTVDTPDDFRLMDQIYRTFYHEGDIVHLKDIIDYLLNHHEIVALNEHVAQKAARDKKILFRVDGHVQKGLGHVMRCLALARHLLARASVEVAFFMQDYPEGIGKVEQAGYKVYRMPQKASLADEEKALQELAAVYQPDLIIIDLLNTSSEHGLLYKEIGHVKIVALDNLGPGGKQADLLINAIVDRDYKYLILNPSIARLLTEETERAHRAKEVFASTSVNPVRRVFMAMGGTDPLNLTGTVLKGLARTSGINEMQVDMVLGPGYAWHEQLKELVQNFHGKVNIYIDVDNMAELMAKCEMALTAAGLTMFELVALGIPSIVLCQNTGQLENARYMAEQGAVLNLGLGEEVSPDIIAAAFTELAKDPAKRWQMAQNARSIVDGQGLQRVGNRILELL